MVLVTEKRSNGELEAEEAERGGEKSYEAGKGEWKDLRRKRWRQRKTSGGKRIRAEQEEEKKKGGMRRKVKKI